MPTESQTKPEGLMREIRIAVATEADYEGMKQISDQYNSDPTTDYRHYFPSRPRDIIQRRDDIHFIAKAQDRIVGFLRIHGGAFNCEASEAECEIVVAQHHQKCGVGTALLGHGIRYARDQTRLSCVLAKVLKTNEPSIKLCEKCGFRMGSEASNGCTYYKELASERRGGEKRMTTRSVGAPGELLRR